MKYSNKNILDYWCNNTIVDCSNNEVVELEEYEIIDCQKEYMDEYVKVTNKSTYNNYLLSDKQNNYLDKKLNINNNDNNDNNHINNYEQSNNIEPKDVIRRNRKLSNTECINKYNRIRRISETIRINSYEPTDKYKPMQERTKTTHDKKELLLLRQGSDLSNR